MIEAKSALLVTSWVTQTQTHANRHTDLHYNNKALMQKMNQATAISTTLVLINLVTMLTQGGAILASG